MSDTLTSKIQELLDNGVGDAPRLEHLKEMLENDKTLFDSDKKYLDSLISKYFGDEEFTKQEKIEQASDSDGGEDTVTESKEDKSKLEKELSEANKKIENLEKKVDDADRQTYHQNYYKSEGTTLVLSIILGFFGIQGVGHIYVGKVGKGIGILIGSLILFAVGIATVAIIVGIPLLIIYFVMFIWQIFDSRKLCRQYNEHIRTTGKSPW